MYEWIGWLATAIVLLSYFPRSPRTLRRIQAVGACFWGWYGVMIHSWPVIVANIIVATAAIASSLRKPAATAALVAALAAIASVAQAQGPATRAVYLDSSGVVRWRDNRQEVSIYGSNFGASLR